MSGLQEAFRCLNKALHGHRRCGPPKNVPVTQSVPTMYNLSITIGPTTRICKHTHTHTFQFTPTVFI